MNIGTPSYESVWGFYMSTKSTDPFGGIQGEKVSSGPDLSKLPALQVDRMEAVKSIKKSLDLWDGVGVTKKTGTLIERFRQKQSLDDEVAENWNYVSEFDKEFADIHLRWSGQVVRSIKHVPAKNVRVALVGLSAFYRNFSTDKPDLSHPDVIKCFNLTAKNFGTELAAIPDDLSFNPESHLDPFAGIKGKDALRLSEFNKDLEKALEEINFSIEYIDQLEVPKYRKEYKFKTRFPKNVFQTYPTSTSFFNVVLWWPGGEVRRIENVKTQRARLALSSMKNALETINVELPNLEDDLVKELYDQTKENFKPGNRKNDHPDLRPVEDGGTSYWSRLSHRWVKGRFIKSKNQFYPPAKGE